MMEAADDGMQRRKASIKETGEELSQAEWKRFDAAVAAAKDERRGDRQGVVEPLPRATAAERVGRREEGVPAKP